MILICLLLVAANVMTLEIDGKRIQIFNGLLQENGAFISGRPLDGGHVVSGVTFANVTIKILQYV